MTPNEPLKVLPLLRTPLPRASEIVGRTGAAQHLDAELVVTLPALDRDPVAYALAFGNIVTLVGLGYAVRLKGE